MPDPQQAARIVSRRRKRNARRSPLFFLTRIGYGLLSVLGLGLVGGIIYFASLYVTVAADLPDIEVLPKLLGDGGALQQPTRLYDRTGEQVLVNLENPNSQPAQYLFLENIPQFAIDATLTVQDPDFWNHPGFKRKSEKPSLAEKLVRDLLLAQEPDSPEKVWRVRLLAAQITRTYGREQILEWYLNSADYGQLAFGIDAASWVYFGKPAINLSLAESALLAAAADAPALNPIIAPTVASERQSQTLSAMLAAGLLTEEQALSANAEPVLLLTTALPIPMTAPEFTSLALERLYDEVGAARVQRGGLEVTTSLDLDLQTQAGCTLTIQLSRVDGSVAQNTPAPADCPAASLLPRLNRDDLLSGADPLGGVVILDPATGQVLALTGQATTPQQAGTALSPFIHLTAYTRGMGPASLVWDIPASLPLILEGYHNFDNDFHGPMRFRMAEAHGYVIPLLSVLDQVGANNVWLTAQQSGLNSITLPALEDRFSPILEKSAFSLLELSHAYSMFAGEGVLAGAELTASQTQTGLAPILILNVDDQSGQRWPVQSPLTRSITSPQLAYLVNDVLSDETARREVLGHPNDFEIARPVAVKQGRGLTKDSTWTIGYTPQMVVGVWVGEFADPEQPALEAELTHAAVDGVWHALMKTVSQGMEIQDWTEPLGIVHQTVCDPSGLLPTADCPKTASEVFITGNEPLQRDNLYQRLSVNTQTGRLATIYTPAELIEEQVYLIIPPEAKEWAENAGLPIPPDIYDVIFNPGPASESVNITSPEIFGYVRGEVEIIGTAAGEDFDTYRVRLGEGLNPRQWLQIGEESRLPVTDDTLAVWDTSGLNGLYAIQLQVISDDQTIETVAVQVTVDNQPPTIQVLRPLPEEVFQYPDERDITFQILADDNLGIQRIEVWVDSSLVSSITDPPYTIPWTGTRGEHTLEVRALDLAGNVEVAVVGFVLE